MELTEADPSSFLWATPSTFLLLILLLPSVAPSVVQSSLKGHPLIMYVWQVQEREERRNSHMTRRG